MKTKAHRTAVTVLIAAYVAWSVFLRDGSKRSKPNSLEYEFRKIKTLKRP